jgi:hypothetical protein
MAAQSQRVVFTARHLGDGRMHRLSPMRGLRHVDELLLPPIPLRVLNEPPINSLIYATALSH